MLTCLEEVITEYVFGRSVAVLDKPDLGYEYAHLGREANKIHAVARAFPTIMRRFFQLPGWMMAGNKMFQVVQRLNNEVYACTEQAFDEAVQQKDKSAVNVMKEIVESSSLPPEEKTLMRLRNEGYVNPRVEQPTRNTWVRRVNTLRPSCFSSHSLRCC